MGKNRSGGLMMWIETSICDGGYALLGMVWFGLCHRYLKGDTDVVMIGYRNLEDLT